MNNSLQILNKLTWVEMKLFVREPLTMVFTFALPVIFVFVMGGVFGNTPSAKVFRGVGPMDYYVPAYFGLVLAAIGVVALPVHLTAYRERGILRRFHASSFSIWSVLASQLIVSFVIAVLGSILIFIVAMIVYSPHLPAQVGLLLPAFFLATLCFTSFGFFLGAVISTTRAAQGLGLILFFVMLILGGAGPPPEVLTGVMRGIGAVMPLHYVIILLQDPWLGFGWSLQASLIVAAITLAAVVLSSRFFKWE
jgi:ABC-2 type transport system permease protein